MSDIFLEILSREILLLVNDATGSRRLYTYSISDWQENTSTRWATIYNRVWKIRCIWTALNVWTVRTKILLFGQYCREGQTVKWWLLSQLSVYSTWKSVHAPACILIWRCVFDATDRPSRSWSKNSATFSTECGNEWTLKFPTRPP